MVPSIPNIAVACLLLAAAGCRSSAFVLPAPTTPRVSKNKQSDAGKSSIAYASLPWASRRSYTYRYTTTLHYLHRPDLDTSSVNFYAVLGVTRDATESDIKGAFRKLAKLYHPDANPGRDTTKQFQMLNRAYEVLRDPKLKNAYDAYGSKGIGTSAASDIENLKREQARRQKQQQTPTRNCDFGSDWPSTGTKGTSPDANKRESGGRSVSVDNAGFGDNPFASRNGASSSRPPRSRVKVADSVGNKVGSRSTGTERPATGSNGPSISNPETFRVDKSIFESTVRSSPRPGNKSQRVKTSTTTSRSQDLQTGPKPNDSTAFFGDMGSVHAQSGTGFSDNSVFGPNDGIAFTCGEDFFGRGPKFGRDVLMDVEIDVKTANSGGIKWIEVRHMEKCSACHGAGTNDQSRSKISTCPHCGGSGHTMNASQMRESCSACSGTGRIISNPCVTCKGSGMEETIKSTQIVIPKQIDDGFTMRIPGQGDVGPNNGPAGDLYVCFSISGTELKKKRTSRGAETNETPKTTVVLNKNADTTTATRPRAAALNAQIATPARETVVSSPAPKVGVSVPSSTRAAALNAQTVTPSPQTVVSPPAPKVGVPVEAATPSSEPKKRGLRGFIGGFVSKWNNKDNESHTCARATSTFLGSRMRTAMEPKEATTLCPKKPHKTDNQQHQDLPRLNSKKRKNGLPFLRMVLTVVGSFLLLPFLYLQYHLLNAHDVRQQHKIAKNLNHFPKQGPDRKVVRRGSPQSRLSPLPSSISSTTPRVLTAYLESPSTVSYHSSTHTPWFSRNTKAAALTKVEFPHAVEGGWCDNSDRVVLPDLPIDDFPTQDPFLPWIHDYFVSPDARFIQFVSQNKRRCDTGPYHMDTMAFWEPQVALFQSVPIVVVEKPDNSSTVRLASSLEEATHPATRFQCRFVHPETNETALTFSAFPFDYEYVTWRKLRSPMIDRKSGSKDMAMFWLSTLLFTCPVPDKWQSLLIEESASPSSSSSSSRRKRILPKLYMDLVPIRTPVREHKFLLTINHTGPDEFAKLQAQKLLFPLEQAFGQKQFLPPPEDAGRWANLPICSRSKQEQVRRLPPINASSTTSIEGNSATNDLRSTTARPLFQFVACTWTAVSYTRRGDVVRVSDSAARLREWIVFHLMVGVEHVYIYDNTELNNNGNTTATSEIWQVTDEFPKEQVTYHAWPCKICNNNRPAHPNPGERSSQYAAEASCRERYGSSTEWMTFLDVDEYLIPMKPLLVNSVVAEEKEYKWGPILDEMKAKGIPILQFLSSRARPRVDMMEDLEDQSVCNDPTGKKNQKFPNTDRCIGPIKGETFLNVYNCDFIRPPKPQRFDRARKQIYQTSYVWSHFIHYSTVTADYAQTYSEFHQRHKDGSGGKFLSHAHGFEWDRRYPATFVDELATGALIHARSVLPHETRRRSAECALGSKSACMVGHLCEDSVKFVDEKHKENVFQNADGSYCNCWMNPVVTQSLIPRLTSRLKEHIRQIERRTEGYLE